MMCNLPDGYKVERIIEYSYAEVGSWSTDAPTEDGWYWVKFSNSAIAILAWVDADKENMRDESGVYFLQGLGKVLRIETYPISDFTHWLGPLPKPEPPT